MNPKIIEEVPLSIYDVKKEVKKIQKRSEILTIRTAKTEEYLNQFLVLKQGDAEELEKKLLEANIPRVKEMHVRKILDTLPENVEELKVILQGYTITVSKENMQKIITVIKEYTAPEKKS
jgi:DNA-directed RNA polymerase subunit F